MSLLLTPIEKDFVSPSVRFGYTLFLLAVVAYSMIGILPRLLAWMNEPTKELDRRARMEEARALHNWEMPSIPVMLLRLLVGLPLLALAFGLLAVWGIIAIAPILATMAFVQWAQLSDVSAYLLCFVLVPVWMMAMWLPPTLWQLLMENPSVQARIDAFWSRSPAWAQ
jgi:hypothetical protein